MTLNAYSITTTPYINTFDNQDSDDQWLVDITATVTLWYRSDIRQVVVLNDGLATIDWMGSGEATGSNGLPALFQFPAANGALLPILPTQYGYFSFNGNYSQAFSPTVTNAFVTLKDVEIKVIDEAVTRLYHFNLNNTCLETVNTIQISPISETTY